MKRIDGAGHVNNLFVNEDAVNNRPPTEITVNWLNGLQEEVCKVILASGAELNGNDFGQLLTALRSGGVFQTAAPGDSSKKAATNEFVQNEFVEFSGEFANSFGSSGYQMLPGGYIRQWVIGESDSSGKMTVTLPIAFTSEICGGIAGERNPLGWEDGINRRTTVWGFDITSSTLGSVVALVRNIESDGIPTPSGGIGGRIEVWGK